MDADAHPQFFCNRHHLPDEIGVVFPKLFLAVLAAVGERASEDLADPMSCRVLFHVEGAGRRSTAGGLTRTAPDAVSHVSVGRVENTVSGQVPQIAFVLLDFLVATRQ